MKISFALLMIASCILGVWAFIATMGYIDNRKKLDKYEGMQSVMPEDSIARYSEPLTSELIAEAVWAEGYVPMIHDDGVSFKVNGENYFIDHESLPVLTILKCYKLDESDYDMDLMRQACHKLSDELIMVKAFVGDKNDGINFQVTVLEHCYGNFSASLGDYIWMIDNAVNRHCAIYIELTEQHGMPSAVFSGPEKSSAKYCN